jgi:cell division protein FtsB
MVTNNNGVPRIEASHDIGMVTAAKLVAIAWAGMVPIVFPAWLIVQGEIRYQNQIQEKEIAQKYVTREEYQEFKSTVRDLKDEVAKLREAIEKRIETENQNRRN